MPPGTASASASRKRKKSANHSPKRRYFPNNQKQAVRDGLAAGKNVEDISDSTGVDLATIQRWKLRWKKENDNRVSSVSSSTPSDIRGISHSTTINTEQANELQLSIVSDNGISDFRTTDLISINEESEQPPEGASHQQLGDMFTDNDFTLSLSDLLAVFSPPNLTPTPPDDAANVAHNSEYTRYISL